MRRRRWSTGAAMPCSRRWTFAFLAGTEEEQALAGLREQLRPRAERDVRADLLLDAIADRDALTPGEDEVSAEIVGPGRARRPVARAGSSALRATRGPFCAPRTSGQTAGAGTPCFERKDHASSGT